MKIRIAILMAAAAAISLPAIPASAQDRPPSNPPTSLGQFFRDLAEASSPGLKAQGNYDRAVAAYETCLDAKPPSACEGERRIMETAAAVAAGHASAPQTNVYIGR
jgi:hypothetical protein